MLSFDISEVLANSSMISRRCRGLGLCPEAIPYPEHPVLSREAENFQSR